MSSLFGNAPPVSGALSKAEILLAQKRAAGPWLNAFSDPIASIKAFTPCVRLADIGATGEYRLIIADADRKLKVYNGTSIQSEHALLDVPSALAVFYTDLNQPQIPSVAVAAGSHIFIYRNLRPYYKFTLPHLEIDPIETEVWSNCRSGTITPAECFKQLSEAHENGVNLTSRSLSLLHVKDEKEQEDYINERKHLQLLQLTVATCMEVLYKNMVAERAVSSLVVGTEAKQVIIMDPSGTSVLKKIELPSVPVFMAISGTYDVEYRIVVACRDGNVYQIKKGKLLGTVIEMESQISGLVLLEKSILVGGMDNTIHSFHFKGNKNFSLYLPEPITNMELLQLSRIKNVKCLLVALANGEVRLYNKKYLVSSFQSNGNDVITAMRFGPYGREEASLILTYKSGGLTIKMLQRQANLDAGSVTPGPPPEQDIPLNVPKKTKLYVEQTQREKEQAVDMHRLFQRDLCKLRLSTARSYVKIITDGVGPLSNVGSAQLRLDAKVQGLGPLFKLKLNIKNTGAKALTDIPLSLSFDENIYRLEKGYSSCILLPILVPGAEYAIEVPVRNIDANGAADAIRVFVSSHKSIVPIISAIVNMPVSEIVEKPQ